LSLSVTYIRDCLRIATKLNDTVIRLLLKWFGNTAQMPIHVAGRHLEYFLSHDSLLKNV